MRGSWEIRTRWARRRVRQTGGTAMGSPLRAARHRWDRAAPIPKPRTRGTLTAGSPHSASKEGVGGLSGDGESVPQPRSARRVRPLAESFNGVEPGRQAGATG